MLAVGFKLPLTDPTSNCPVVAILPPVMLPDTLVLVPVITPPATEAEVTPPVTLTEVPV